jgi:hypothetical protein
MMETTASIICLVEDILLENCDSRDLLLLRDQGFLERVQST